MPSFPSATLSRSGLALALLWLLALPPVRAAGPQIWFCPLDPFLRPEVGYNGSPQYMNLFQPDAPWPVAAAHVNIFKIYPQWITRASDDDLRRQFADLKRRGIALALEFGVLTTEGDAGRGVEGFGGQQLVAAAQRIQRDGGDLRYVGMDEPFFFATLYDGHNAPRWTVRHTVDVAVRNMKALLAVDPAVRFGDIEPSGVAARDQMLRNYREGWDAFRAAGIPLASYTADLDWESPVAMDHLRALRDAAHAAQLSFGIIYDGDPRVPTSAAWLDSAQAHAGEAENAVGTPDLVVFQSWNAQPKKLLPETDPDSFTHFIDAYYRPRTSLTAALAPGRLSGALVTDDGRPLAGASLSVTATVLSGPGTLADYTATGLIPTGATEIRFGFRADNNEAAAFGPVDLRVRRFVLQPENAAPIRLSFSEPGAVTGNLGQPLLTQLEEGALHLQARDGQPVALESAPLPLASGGKYTFSVQARVEPLSRDHGYFAVFFMHGGKELGRGRIAFDYPTRTLGTAVTDAAGAWSLALPPPSGQVRYLILYPGDAAHWPSWKVITTSS